MGELKRVTAKTAEQITPHFDLSEEGAALLTPQLPPGDFLDELMAAGLHTDAVNLLAHGLGRREAVWWACVCARAALEPEPAPDVMQTLAAAEAWCYDPDDDKRKIAFDTAEAQGREHPAAWASMGAFWGGENMAPEESQVVVAPGPFMTAKAVSAAVILAAVRREPEKAPERYADFIARGIDIANGGWGNEPADG